MGTQLLIFHNDQLLQTLKLRTGCYTIGSEISQAPDTITLNYPSVSRKHAKLRVDDSTWITDLGSRNGTLLELSSSKLNPHTEYKLCEKNPVRIGPFRLEVVVRQNKTDAEYLHQYEELLKTHGPKCDEMFLQQMATQGCSDDGNRILAEAHGHGPLAKFVDDPQCREILVNDYNQIYVDTGDGLNRINHQFISETSYLAWIQRLAHDAGRRLDLQHPICEATLPNGARLHAVLAPIAATCASVAIRRFGAAPVTIERALATKWMTPKALNILREGIEKRKNIIISGGTSSGKTSLLNFVCQFLDSNERVITVEDTLELSLPIQNTVRLQSRHSNADGVGEVTLRQLVQCALRMRPDRIVVGECRGAEVLEMLQALNTGHPGSLTTVHANSAHEALNRLELLALLGAPNLSIESIREWIRSSVHWIIQVERSKSGQRHVREILEISGETLHVLYST